MTNIKINSRNAFLRYGMRGLGVLAWGLVSCSANIETSSIAPFDSGAVEISPPEAQIAAHPGAEGADRATSASGEALVAQASPSADKSSAGDDRALPQLIKTADLEVIVEDTSASIEQVRGVIQQNQGDLLQLQDNRAVVDTVPQNAPQNAPQSAPQSAYVQLRVPQDRLEITIEGLSALGQVKSRTIRAEDVSNQLVDFEARLRNLRRSEEAVLKILDRSGEVGEILQVAQELSRIREQIEQIAAQLQRLKNQVAYSTINLYLAESVASLPPLERSWSQTLEQAWQGATRSFLGFTQGLFVLGVWLVVYSPYWLGLGGGSIVLFKFLRSRSRQ